MTQQVAADFEAVLAHLRRRGLLLRSDFELPNVASLVAGEHIRGSWWGHPLGHEIHAIAERLAAHPDVVSAKLVSGKDTFVHREVWRELLAVGRCGERWQRDGLSRLAESLLERVERAGALRLDRLGKTRGFSPTAPAELARDLERRLLVLGEAIPGETGRSARQLVTWDAWARRESLDAPLPSVALAKARLEEIVEGFGKGSRGAGRLPWMAPPVRSARPRPAPRPAPSRGA